MNNNGVNGKMIWTVLLGALLLMVPLYFVVDAPLTFFFQEHKRGVIGGIFKVVTWFGRSEMFFIPAAVLFLLCRTRRPAVARKAAFIFACVVASGLAVDVLKFLFGRARPSLLLDENIYGFHFFRFSSEWSSFPSGHSATAASMALAFAWLFPRYRVLFFIGGFLVAISRMVVVAHFPSDVVGGAAAGLLIAYVLRSTLFRSMRAAGEIA